MFEDEEFVLGGNIFEWNKIKAASNVRKHQVRFAEAATVFVDREAILIADPDHSEDESRFILMGLSRMGRILVVVFAERGKKFPDYQRAKGAAEGAAEGAKRV